MLSDASIQSMPAIRPKSVTNKFANLADLGNEATVEQFFVNRLLEDLGYKDADILPKTSIKAQRISRGSKSENFKPDYALKVRNRIRWICEAKSVNENLDDWAGQARSYCLQVNKSFKDNPVELFVLTNGVTTRVYRWDQDAPLLELPFHNFVDGNERYTHFRSLLAKASISREPQVDPTASMFTLERRTVSELNVDFAWAHKVIYKRENMSYNAAFMEFVKLIFLKLLSDRTVHDSPNLQVVGDIASVPLEEVQFSLGWIQRYEKDTANPLDTVAFQKLLQGFETQIQEGNKKRIFDPGERLNLSPDTVKTLVERFQHVDLISIDADLNGRMFETFLNSTLRGKALGQYFTSRSVVKLATQVAQLRATPSHVDRVIDACCGTGGFLIEALAVMWQQANDNSALSNSQKEELRTQVAVRALFGVDVAREPTLARIARINMYLHGDGGSSIYQFDALDKRVRRQTTDSPEIGREKAEFRSILKANPDGLADVVLTNPPFAKDYSRDATIESQMLDDYELAYATAGGARRPLPTVSSMVLFLERYHDLLKPGGRLVTVIDDGLLGSKKYRPLRDWIRKSWIVRAVISLPGDAFQRSQARVKTSVLILTKKTAADEAQPDVFMYYCTAVGVDDAPRQRVLPVDEINRRAATAEIARVRDLYDDFVNGRSKADPWSVPAAAISDRLDVKACLPKAARRVDDWLAAGFDIVALGDIADLIDVSQAADIRTIDLSLGDHEDELVTYLRVRYDGYSEPGDTVWTSDIGASKLLRVEQGDIVFSHINTIHGAVAVVPEEHAGLVVTNEYSVCRAREGVDPLVVWSLIRSPEARADLLLLSTGIGRTRVRWEEAKNLRIPMPPDSAAQSLADTLRNADEAERTAATLRASARNAFYRDLQLESPAAQEIIAAFKPPR